MAAIRSATTAAPAILRARWLWLLTLSLQLPAARSVLRYVFPAAAGPGTAAVLALTLLAAWLCYRLAVTWLPPRLSTVAAPRLLAAAGLAILVVVAWVYPHADGLKTEMRGSDSDDALVLAVESLFEGENPYTARTYFGNPLSPGPGWILLWIPAVIAGIHFLATPLLMLAAAFALRRVDGSWRPGLLLVLALMTSLGVWEILAVGGDQLAIGLAMTLAVLAAHAVGTSPGKVVAVAILSGLIATARVPFFYFPIVVATLLATRDRRLGVLAGVVGTLVCAGLHLLFYLWGPGDYSPLHLLAKGQRLTASPAVRALLIAAVAAAILVVLRFGRKTPGFLDPSPSRWLLVAWASLLPLAAVAAGDLAAVGFDFRAWEGASYLLPPLPLFAAFFAGRLVEAERGGIAIDR